MPMIHTASTGPRPMPMSGRPAGISETQRPLFSGGVSSATVVMAGPQGPPSKKPSRPRTTTICTKLLSMPVKKENTELRMVQMTMMGRRPRWSPMLAQIRVPKAQTRPVMEMITPTWVKLNLRSSWMAGMMMAITMR